MSQPQANLDPLLDFSIEPDSTPAATPDASREAESIATPAVPSASSAQVENAEEVGRLRSRVDRLERSLDHSAKELRALRSEVATLVAAKRDISPKIGRVGAAVVGLAIGVGTGAWLWTAAADADVIAPKAPVTIASAAPAPQPAPPPPAPAAAPIAPPALVPVAAITSVTPAPERINYVGTLTIDAEPDGNVLIDRRPAGRTPVRAENLKAGSHLIWIERDGYRRFTRVVQVPSDRVTRLVADLEPAQR